jgi:hypothetical protein
MAVDAGPWEPIPGTEKAPVPVRSISLLARDAEAALAFLVEQGMVEVVGDTIIVPASFWSGGRVPAT